MSYVGNAYGGGSAEPYCAAKVCPLKYVELMLV